MSNNNRGKEICSIINYAMPCFIKNLDHIIHRYNESGYTLNGNQIKVINAVKILGSISPSELSRILGMQKGSLSTIISSLVKQNLLFKTFSKTDPRRYTLSITTEAIKLLENKNRSDSIKYNEIFSAMPDTDFIKIKEGFSLLLKYLNNTKRI